MIKKILIFTDSRGQHKPAGTNHEIFGERIKNEAKNIEVDLILCPMKWTTTLDFIEYIKNHDISDYNWIILYTGIVEWSPRPQKNAINDLYNNKNTENLNNWHNNSRDYSKKIVNNKKNIFDDIFGEKEIKEYLEKPFEIKYENQSTINMYSLEMLKKNIAPEIRKIKNLIFINSNRILSDWEGDFKRGRPENISITHDYSDVFSSIFPSERLIDLRLWDKNEIKKYTCDNMHLTKEGSDWIMNKLIEKMSLELKTKWEVEKNYFESKINHDINEIIKIGNIERFVGAKKDKFISNYTNEKYLATLIIGMKLPDNDPSRIDNLKFLIDWIEYHYENMFEILLVEQDKTKKFDTNLVANKDYIKYEFLYNPEDYNRGWGYNVAVEHFCKNSKVVVLMDTDVLTGNNFIAKVRDCYINKFKIISPYQNIYYSTYEEVLKIKEDKKLSHLNIKENIKNPVTITGGIVIFDRKTYLELKGFEQYIGYGCEDRALDTMILGLCAKEQIEIANEAYVHLYHPTDKIARKNFNEIYSHLKENYKCEWSPNLKKTDFIHKFCQHVSKEDLIELLIKKSINFADINLYKSNVNLSANGMKQIENAHLSNSILLPPEFTNLDNYKQKELYDAPEPDCSELAIFRNAFLGKRCFIIGNGPSLNKHNLSLLKNEYTFGVNSFYYKTKETGFRPTFYVVEDNSVMKENIEEIRKYHAPFKFFPTIYKKLHPKNPNTFFFTMNRGFYEKSSPNYCVPRFSTDATKELYCGQSVTYINLQLAYFMGFTEVYLLGMDFSYIIPDSHKRTGDVLLSDSDDPNHFHKDYFGKGKTWKDPKLERVGANYKMAKLVFESTGRKIYNATVGGSLEIFERVNYENLFKDKKNENENEKISINIGNFADANKLYVEKRFTDALVIYVNLAESNPDFSIYKQSALNCYFKAKELKQPIQDVIIDRIKKLI